MYIEFLRYNIASYFVFAQPTKIDFKQTQTTTESTIAENTVLALVNESVFCNKSFE